MPCTILLLLKLPGLRNTLTPSSSVYPSCRYSLWVSSQARIAVSFNGIARILLLASGTQFDSVKREIEVRNIFEYSWGNVEELLLCWSSVRRRLLTHGGHISGFIPKTNFLTPNRFFSCSFRDYFSCSLWKGSSKKRALWKPLHHGGHGRD